MSNVQHRFRMDIDPSGIIILTLTGDLLERDMTDFTATLDVSSIAIAHLDQKNSGQKQKVLFDASLFSGKYCAAAVAALVAFAKKNEPYVQKTACFGVTTAVKVIGEVIILLSQRQNIEIFNNREEAIAWLNES